MVAYFFETVIFIQTSSALALAGSAASLCGFLCQADRGKTLPTCLLESIVTLNKEASILLVVIGVTDENLYIFSGEELAVFFEIQ